MARIAGVTCADQAGRNRADLHLRDRPHSAAGIVKEAGVDPSVRVKDLSEDDVRKISRVIEEQGRVEAISARRRP